jgi:Domain of unknown function (DUF4091)
VGTHVNRPKRGRLVLYGLVGVTFAGVCASLLGPGPQDAARAAGEQKWHVWTASGMERVGRTDPPFQHGKTSIWAARGEYEPFQIVISATSAAVTGVDLEASDLTGPGASIIPAAALTLYREHYVQVTSPSPDPGQGNRPLGKGWYPDALIPFADPQNGRRLTGESAASPFDVAPHTNQPVWVDIHVPSDARAGTYTGSVRVSSSELDVHIPVSLHVWNFTFPVKPTLKSSFGMHEPNLTDRRVHEVLLQHRVMPESVNPGDAREFEEKFGLNTTALRFWGNFNRTTCTMDLPPTEAQIASASKLYPSSLPLRMYPADEIDPCRNLFNTVRQWAANMHAANPRIRNLVTVSPTPALYDDGRGSGRSAVDIWTLLPSAYEAARPQVLSVQAKGDDVWSYTALVQDSYSPKWEIDFAPINYRIQPGFISQSLGLTGILYWRVDLWSRAPWDDMHGFSIDGNFYPGEGMLVYPARQVSEGSVLPSMRLKWIREGVDDYEYIAILKRLGRGGWALDRARRVGADWRNWTRDPAVLESVRHEFGDEIERLSTGLGSTSPDQPR